MMKKRLDYVDAAKAIAIYLVIVGHIVPGSSMIFRFIFAFHMPAFFFFAGHTTPRSDRTFLETVKRKSATLLLPALVFVIIGFILMALVPEFRPEASLKGWIGRYLYMATPFKIGQIWFLVCLFFASLAFYVVLKVWSSKRAWTLLFPLAGFFLAGAFLYEIVLAKHFGHLPWKLDSAIMAVSFMLGGYLFRETKIMEKIRLPFLIAGIVVLPVLVWLFGVRLNGYVNLCDCIYGNPLWYFIAAYAGSVWLLFLGKATEKLKFLPWLGRMSMPIFLVHGELIWLALKLYALLTGTVKEYLNDGPKVFILGIIVYAASIPFALLYEWIRKLIRNALQKKRLSVTSQESEETK